MKARGMGLVFRPTWKDKATGELKTSPVWFIQFNANHKRYRENSGSQKKGDAERLLKRRIAEAGSGRPCGVDVTRTRLSDMLAMIEADYRMNDQNVSSIAAPIDHLRDYFGADCYAANVTADRITNFTITQQQAGASNATVNRSLSCLKRAFALALRAGRVVSKPYVGMLAENNARQGFLNGSEFERLHAALPADLRDPVEFLYRSGWRVGEMRSLEWRDVDLAGAVIRLRPEVSKNREARVLPLRREIAAIIERARARRRPESPFVFHRDNGAKIGLFRKSWATACKQAGLGAILVHDLRRCAIRNMIRAGTPDLVAMRLSGHKTRSVFDRYNIVSEDDLASAIEKVSDHLASQPQVPATVVPLRASTSR